MTMTDSSPPGPAAQPNRVLRGLFVALPRLVAACLILAGIGINFANVVSRHVFNFALFWAEEALIFIIIWCVFIGAVAVAFNGANLRMDLVSARIAHPWRLLVNGAAAVTFVICGVFAVVQSLHVVSLFHAAGQVSVAAGVPMTLPHAAIPIGFSLMVLAVLVRFRAYLTGRF